MLQDVRVVSGFPFKRKVDSFKEEERCVNGYKAGWLDRTSTSREYHLLVGLSTGRLLASCPALLVWFPGSIQSGGEFPFPLIPTPNPEMPQLTQKKMGGTLSQIFILTSQNHLTPPDPTLPTYRKSSMQPSASRLPKDWRLLHR